MLSAETYRKVVVQATVSHDDEERVLHVSYLLSSLNIEHNEGKTEDLQKHSWFLTPMCTKSVCGVFAARLQLRKVSVQVHTRRDEFQKRPRS